MKLIFCQNCHDVFKLHSDFKTCLCSASGGRYIDDLNAVITGEGIPLGFDNNDFVKALKTYKEVKIKDKGFVFKAFIIPDNAKTVKHET